MKSRKDKLSTLKVYLYIQNTVTAKHTRQSHYIEVAQGDIFWNRKLDLSLVWAGWQYWGLIMSNSFFMFSA